MINSGLGRMLESDKCLSKNIEQTKKCHLEILCFNNWESWKFL